MMLVALFALWLIFFAAFALMSPEEAFLWPDVS